jgi:hypothetical protein
LLQFFEPVQDDGDLLQAYFCGCPINQLSDYQESLAVGADKVDNFLISEAEHANPRRTVLQIRQFVFTIHPGAAFAP